jgi:heme exporter protein C
MFAVAGVITPLGVLFFGFDLSRAPGTFLGVMALSLIGFAAVGTLFASLVSSSRLQGGLMAMMVFPVALPLVVASTQLLLRVFRDGEPAGGHGIGILVAFDVIFLAVTLASLAAAVWLLAGYTPREATMGQIQKIFYLHLPVAISTFLACLVCFVASIAFLFSHRMAWDDLGAAAARVAVQLCTVVLLTGMIWGQSAWGRWWTWSPRLTFSLLLLLLYIVYLMIRGSIESRQRRAMVCAAYGIIAFLDVPLVYLSVRLMPDIHPTSVKLAAPMKLTLMAWFVPVLLMAGGLLWAQCRVNVLRRRAGERTAERAAAGAGEAEGSLQWKMEAI